MDGNFEPGPSKLMSPVKKHVQGKGLTSGEKIQIVNVYKTLLKENPEIAMRDIGHKVALSMGVALSTIFKIVKEYKCTGEVKSPVRNKSKTKTIINDTEDWVKCAIRRKVHRFYFNNEIPTVKKILDSVIEAVQSITSEQWQNCIKHVIGKEEPTFWDFDNRMEEVAEVINLGFVRQ